ncbi:MAG: RNA polymerase sigma factor [Clostridia bacterium]|nr:RNA polymerase sigma factor [Clostridia bacterium]
MMDFDAAYEQYSRLVYWVAFNVVKNQDEALDVSQEVFLRMYDRRESVLRYNDLQLKGWLYRVATNAALDVVRKRKRETLYDEAPFNLADTSLNPLEQLVDDERQRLLMQAVDRLSDIYREPVMLHYFSGLNYAEIGRLLNLTEGTVKSRMSRARAKLAELIGDDEGV